MSSFIEISFCSSSFIYVIASFRVYSSCNTMNVCQDALFSPFIILLLFLLPYSTTVTCAPVVLEACILCLTQNKKLKLNWIFDSDDGECAETVSQVKRDLPSCAAHYTGPTSATYSLTAILCGTVKQEVYGRDKRSKIFPKQKCASPGKRAHV